MLFRFIHMAIDLSQGMLPPFDFASYAGYQLLFFTITAGPIQQYNEFYAYWNDPYPPAPGRRDVLLCWSRLLTGAI